jgi:hypothetical protein
VSGGWLITAVIAVVVAPGFARRLGAALTASEGVAAPEPTAAAPPSAGLPGAAGEQAPSA